MGLTSSSVGNSLLTEKNLQGGKVIALAGSPNVGKSTVFNALTGLNQHTGNWTGKTVSNAIGRLKGEMSSCLLADIPGTYSLSVHSSEETVARDFLLFGGCDGIICVCDTLALERNLCLVLSLREYTEKITVCLNLTDQADKKGIRYDEKKLSDALGISFIKCSAGKNKGLKQLAEAAMSMLEGVGIDNGYKITYPYQIEDAVKDIEKALAELCSNKINTRFTALRLLCGENELCEKISQYCGVDIRKNEKVENAVKTSLEKLEMQGIKPADVVAETVCAKAKSLCENARLSEGSPYGKADRTADRLLTGKITAIPIMLILLALLFFITLEGANYPSRLLSRLLFSFEDKLYRFLEGMGVQEAVCSLVTQGVYRTTVWVVSVMLPPMAIFFPLFTLLEDTGVLPRIAFNLDRAFSACNSCGKQALTMCMGFGCNAAGVVGCRIIDSDRERITAILTNSFVPCNGRLPILVSIISMFLVYSHSGQSGLLSSVILAAFVVLGIIMTLIVSFLLSKTILKGKKSSYILELPSYRCPRVGNILVRSFLDRTLFVLGRAVITAAPMGIIIWMLAHISVGDSTLLSICTDFLHPFGKVFGMDGVIIMAFILGLPANEIVFPIIVMSYMATGTLSSLPLSQLRALLLSNGWTVTTAVCVAVFTLFHFPCATTLLTVKKETGRWYYTALAAVLPTLTGLSLCFLINLFSHQT